MRACRYSGFTNIHMLEQKNVDFWITAKWNITSACFLLKRQISFWMIKYCTKITLLLLFRGKTRWENAEKNICISGLCIRLQWRHPCFSVHSFPCYKELLKSWWEDRQSTCSWGHRQGKGVPEPWFWWRLAETFSCIVLDPHPSLPSGFAVWAALHLHLDQGRLGYPEPKITGGTVWFFPKAT